MINRIRSSNLIFRIGDDRSLVRDVRLSDIVILDSMKKCECAIGIIYDTRYNSVPFISCIGKGNIAKRIYRIGNMRNINMKEDPNLVTRMLESAGCVVGCPIPASLYQPVAKVLASVYAQEIKKL